MSTHHFEVKPVESYDKARYFAAPIEEPAAQADDDQPHPLMVLATMVLVLGISVGLIGCYMRSEYTTGEPPDPQPDADPPDPPDCDDGALQCADDMTLETCDGGEWVAENCFERCVEELGYDGYSLGCDADAEDPCQCEYDILDGDVAYCDPDDLFCADDMTLNVCNGEFYEAVDCNELCQEELGPEGISYGCDAENAEDPCQCDYDILDGDVAYCDPDSLICFDETTLGVCDGEVYVSVDCDERCDATFGPGSVSEGCDATAPDNPCQCSSGPSGSGGE